MNFSKSTIVLSLFVLLNAMACVAINKNSYAAEIESQSIPLEKIAKIDIKTVSADIEIIPSKNSKIEITLSGEKPKEIQLLEVNQSKSSVKIKIERPNDEKLNRQCKNLQLHISLPQKVYKQLKIKSVSGDISLSKINSLRAKIKSVSGDLYASNVDIDFNINTVSGDAKLTTLRPFRELTFHSVSGDLEIGMDKMTGFFLNFKTVSGDVETSFPGGKYLSKFVKMNYQLKNLDEKIKIDVRTVSGDLKI